MAAPSLRRASLSALAAVLVLTALGSSVAQVPAPTVGLSLDTESLDLGAANTSTVTGTVTYNDQVPGGSGTITLTVTAPDGWVVEVEPASAFTLTPGQSAPVTLTLTAPEAGVGALTGEAVLTAAANAGTGRPGATATATLALARVDPIIPPPDYTPVIVAASLGVLAVIAAVTAVLVRRHRRAQAAAKAAEEAAAEAAFLARETGITLTPIDGPLPFGDRREVIYRLAVANESDRPRIATVGIVECPAAWRAAPSIPRIPLSSGERVVVSIFVSPGATVPPGEVAHIVVRARPEEAQERDERVTLEVPAPMVRIPVDGGKTHRPLREGITSRGMLRR